MHLDAQRSTIRAFVKAYNVGLRRRTYSHRTASYDVDNPKGITHRAAKQVVDVEAITPEFGEPYKEVTQLVWVDVEEVSPRFTIARLHLRLREAAQLAVGKRARDAKIDYPTP